MNVSLPDVLPMSASCATSMPFVVDLDGTLVKSDLLFECVMSFVRSKPLHCLKLLPWLWHGKAYLKDRLAMATDIDVATLPYDPDALRMIEEQRNAGRKVVLATASHHTLAVRIAEHLKLFDDVLGTTLEQNLSGTNKRDVLVTLYGEKGFDYIGNSLDDLPIWRSARRAYIVNPLAGVERATRHMDNVVQVVQSRVTYFRSLYKALRIHQWMKNVLIFVPLLAAHLMANPLLLGRGMLAFILFGLCASSVYLLNDLLDLNDDRKHPTKRNRPFASGSLSIQSGLVVFPCCCQLRSSVPCCGCLIHSLPCSPVITF